MRQTHAAVLVVMASALTACASTSPGKYRQADGAEDVGYYEHQLTENRYRVSYNGSAVDSADEVKDMALLRASELTILNDHDWFRVIVQETEKEVVPDVDTASTTVNAGNRVYRDCGLLGCTTTVSPAYTQIETTRFSERDSYSTSIEIVMGDGEVGTTSSAYNARELRSFLEPRY